MTLASSVLGLGRARWARVGPASLWSAAALVVGASVLLSLTRFGGLVVDAPRAFVRMTLVGVYGWLGLAAAVWLLTIAVQQVLPFQAGARRPSLEATVAAVGLAHSPILILALAVFTAGGMLDILGPGLAVAAFSLGLWFPTLLVAATKHTQRIGYVRATAIVAPAYLGWWLTAGRHLIGRVQHLL